MACDPGDVPVTSKSMPYVQAWDQIEVYFLRAPLLKTTLNSTILGAFGLFHSGVGFRSLNQSTWQFEYDAINFNAALFPMVTIDTVSWGESKAEVCSAKFNKR